MIHLLEWREDPPSIMIIPVYVENLFALHAHNSSRGQLYLEQAVSVTGLTQTAHILLNLWQVTVSHESEEGFTQNHLPVPRTTTSYSGAISSMVCSTIKMPGWIGATHLGICAKLRRRKQAEL